MATDGPLALVGVVAALVLLFIVVPRLCSLWVRRRYVPWGRELTTLQRAGSFDDLDRTTRRRLRALRPGALSAAIRIPRATAWASLGRLSEALDELAVAEEELTGIPGTDASALDVVRHEIAVARIAPLIRSGRFDDAERELLVIGHGSVPAVGTDGSRADGLVRFLRDDDVESLRARLVPDDASPCDAFARGLAEAMVAFECSRAEDAAASASSTPPAPTVEAWAHRCDHSLGDHVLAILLAAGGRPTEASARLRTATPPPADAPTPLREICELARAELWCAEGRGHDAADHLRTALATHTCAEDRRQEAFLHERWAAIAAPAGRDDEARANLRLALEHRQVAGPPRRARQLGATLGGTTPPPR